MTLSNRTGNRRSLTILPAALGLLAPFASAQAQPVGQFLLDRYFAAGIPGVGATPGVTVLSRERPEYDAPGVRAGSFIIRPEVNESLGYNDNVLGTKKAHDSMLIDTQAGVTAASDWGRHSVDASVSVDDRRLPSLSEQDRTDWNASIGGRLDIGRDALAVGYSHYSLHQDPTDIDARQNNLPGNFSTAPLPYTLDDVHVSYNTTFGRFGFTPDIEYSRLRFSNLRVVGLDGAIVPPPAGGRVLGLPISQEYRDRDILQGGITGRYEFSPLHNAVLVIRDTNTDYVSPRASEFGPSRSSNAISVLAGIDYVSSAVWRYRLLIGYEMRDFNSPQYKNRAAPIAEANVIWTPTGLTTVTAKVARTIEDAADENVAGYEYTSAQLRVDHEYLRNVLLDGYIGLQRADYLGQNSSETLYQFGAGATYLVNRNVRLSLTYDLVDRQGSRNFGSNYLQNIYMLSARLAL
jgi:hypothetical protein